MAIRRGWAERLPPRSELALAVLLTAVMAASLNQALYPLLSLMLVVPAGLSLAWRLQYPRVPLVAISITNLVVFGTAPPPYGPQTLVFGLLLAIYTAAARPAGWPPCSGRRVVLPGAAVVGADGDARGRHR